MAPDLLRCACPGRLRRAAGQGLSGEGSALLGTRDEGLELGATDVVGTLLRRGLHEVGPVSYTHLRAHETVLDLVCRLLLEKKNY